MIKELRLSIGTAMALGMRKGHLPIAPTTAYLMVGKECVNNCAFCTQARGAESSGELLSRVIWPEFQLEDAMKALEGARDAGMRRICLQCLIDPRILSDLPKLIADIIDRSDLQISVSISALDRTMLEKLKDAGASRIGIALDGASARIFNRIKGKDVGNPYTWDGNWRSLKEAVEIFGKGRVSTHIIVGLGETDKEIIDTMVKCERESVLVSLFAYTPMKGTMDIGDAPELERYRALQMVRSLIIDHGVTEGFSFGSEGRLKAFPRGSDVVDPVVVFQTRGCPNCNRPYYNERPRGPMYNFPRELTDEESGISLAEALRYVNG